MLLSRHYSVADFAQPPSRGREAVAYPPIWQGTRLRALAAVLDLLALRTNLRPQVLSGYRAAGMNVRVNGRLRGSTHTDGYAADIFVPGRGLDDIYRELYQMHLEGTHLGGLGLFPAYIHLDISPQEQLIHLGADPEQPLQSLRETLCLLCERPFRLCRELGCRAKGERDE